MDKKSKVLFWIFGILLATSVGMTFYKYVIKKDYMVLAYVSCDSQTESCFYVPCEGIDCTAEIDYYKIINKKAYNIELCDPEVEGCNPLVCKEGEKDCEIIFCSADTLSEGEECSIVTATVTEN
ncbi:MAG: hypothetical protein WCC74_00650 [Minisyncoccia bacterium]